MTTIPRTIFRAYDIRGRAEEQLTAEACRLIARAFGSEIRERTRKESPTLCVGRDARITSPDYETAVITGLTEAGCTVLRIGQTPSPVNYFTICHRSLDGGIQVTASHNPSHDNGLKLSVHDAEAFAGDDIQLLRERIERGDFLSGEGRVEEIDGITPYKEKMQAMFGTVADGMKIAVDAGNGVAGPLYCEVLRAAGAEVVELYTEPDGRFPNHAADPSKHDTLRDLQQTMQEQGCAVGLAYDGDGDRMGLVDETGRIRTADEIILLLAKDHLARHPGAPIIFTVSNSGVLRTEIRQWGGEAVMTKVGHSFVEHTMREHGSLLGGEQSGHFFCGEEYYSFDDALVASLRVLSILQKSGQSLSALFAEFPQVYQAPEYRPHVEDERKAAIVAHAIDHFGKSHTVHTLDGARVEFDDDSWIGIRQSNTSPCLSICMEARSPERLRELEQLVQRYFDEHHGITW